MISHQPAKSLFLNDKEYWMSKNRLLKNSVIWASFEGSSSRLLFERLVRSKRPYNITSLWRLFLQRTNMRLKNGLIASNSLYGPRKMEKSRRNSLNPKQVTKMSISLFHGNWFQNKKPLVTPPSPPFPDLAPSYHMIRPFWALQTSHMETAAESSRRYEFINSFWPYL